MDSVTTTLTKDNLLVGHSHVTWSRVVLTAPGADKTYSRGTVLAKNTATSKIVPYVKAGADGVGTPYAILAQDITFAAADSDKNIVYYVGGGINANGLIFEGDGAVADVEDTLRSVGIYLDTETVNNAFV